MTSTGLILAAFLAGLLATSCASGPGTRPVASISGAASSTRPATGPLTWAQFESDEVYFARCMRSHGVQMSDPFHQVGHQRLTLDTPPRTASNRSAFAACHHFVQPEVQAKQAKEARGAAQAAAHLSALIAYAACMRGHDIGMLDPDRNGAVALGNVPGITHDVGRASPEFGTADAACRHLLPAGVRDDGTGP